jgi:flagellar basal-body rod protein FlgG
MIRGLYTSAIGMGIQQKRLDVAANNLSNAGTTGFSRDVVVTQSFSDVMMRSVRDYELRGHNVVGSAVLGPMSFGLTINTVHRDFTPGSLSYSGVPLDVAIDGRGFFRVNFVDINGDSMEMFTRNGRMTTTPDGTLVTMGGYHVLDTNGNSIVLPDGIINIWEGGEVSVNGELIATISLVDFTSLADLRPFGHSLYFAIEEAVEIPFGGTVQQGYLESSNSNIMREMVEMISLSRTYEANSRMVTMQDESLRRAVSDIARF